MSYMEKAEDAFWEEQAKYNKPIELDNDWREMHGGTTRQELKEKALKNIYKGTRTSRIYFKESNMDEYFDNTYVATQEPQPGNHLGRRIEELQRQLEDVKRQREFLEQLPKEPGNDNEDNSLTPVVYFEKSFPNFGRVYKYAAIKITQDTGLGLWYASGPKAPKGVIWHELLLWLMETDPEHKLPEMKVSFVENWDTLS